MVELMVVDDVDGDYDNGSSCMSVRNGRESLCMFLPFYYTC